MFDYFRLHFVVSLIVGINGAQFNITHSNTHVESDEHNQQCPSNGENILLPGQDCQHYYKCNNGIRVLCSCPSLEEWSQELKRCDKPDIAQCSSGKNKSTKPKSIPECTVENEQSSAEDCQHYYQCIHEKLVLRSCPNGLEWNQVSKNCDWPKIAQCSNTVPNECTSLTGYGDKFLPGKDCEHYYICSNDRPILMPCPSGLHWSQTFKRCEWPAVAKCSAGNNSTSGL